MQFLPGEKQRDIPEQNGKGLLDQVATKHAEVASLQEAMSVKTTNQKSYF